MRILIALHDPTNVEETLHFAAQFTRRIEQAPQVLAVTENTAKTPQARQMLLQAEKILGIPECHAHLRTGATTQEILNEVQEGKCDLLILGGHRTTHRRSRIHRPDAILEIVERCPCPVIVVKGQAQEVNRILMCDSGAENSVLSRFVAQMADLLEGEEEVTVLHVMSQISAGPGVRGRQLRADALELIQEGAPEGKLFQEDIRLLDRRDVHPTAKVRHGLVVDEIIDETHQGDYDLVVIGAHGGQGWQRYLLEDLAREIFLAVNRPVLIVK